MWGKAPRGGEEVLPLRACITPFHLLEILLFQPLLKPQNRTAAHHLLKRVQQPCCRTGFPSGPGQDSSDVLSNTRIARLEFDFRTTRAILPALLLHQAIMEREPVMVFYYCLASILMFSLAATPPSRLNVAPT